MIGLRLQVELTKNSYIGIYLRFGLNMILVYSRFNVQVL